MRVGRRPDPEQIASFRSQLRGEVLEPGNPDYEQARKGYYWMALHPFSAGGAYLNFIMEEGEERVRASYSDNYARLAHIKAAYDPENLFHINQNIIPAAK